jgi:hypothetical protein
MLQFFDLFSLWNRVLAVDCFFREAQVARFEFACQSADRKENSVQWGNPPTRMKA